MSGGALIFLVVVLVILAGLVPTAYTRRGSGISEEPDDGMGAAPGAKTEPSADPTKAPDRGDPTSMDTRGTAP